MTEWFDSTVAPTPIENQSFAGSNSEIALAPAFNQHLVCFGQ